MLLVCSYLLLLALALAFVLALVCLNLDHVALQRFGNGGFESTTTLGFTITLIRKMVLLLRFPHPFSPLSPSISLICTAFQSRGSTHCRVLSGSGMELLEFPSASAEHCSSTVFRPDIDF